MTDPLKQSLKEYKERAYRAEIGRKSITILLESDYLAKDQRPSWFKCVSNSMIDGILAQIQTERINKGLE